MITTEIAHEVKLIDGEFTPSEALDIINGLIKEKINFHKIHRLSMLEGNVNCDTKTDDSRVSQLLKAKEDFKAFYKEAKQEGRKFKISGLLELELVD
ncbi:MAG: hypothetical protein HKO92_07945 [Flavobacteriaceae bacterium]|nr:hypothetical protein [Flavobacteriaceae bacterium]